jgi:hypothetical protein
MQEKWQRDLALEEQRKAMESGPQDLAISPLTASIIYQFVDRHGALNLIDTIRVRIDQHIKMAADAGDVNRQRKLIEQAAALEQVSQILHELG